MDFLYFLQNIRTGIGDFFFGTVTHLGEETAFLALAILFFWCIDKREGYYILMTGVIGTVVNQWLKIVCRIPRPWLADSRLHPVGGAVKEATGYSFPSGHTQNVAGTFGCIGRYNKQRWVKISAAVIIVLVAFSRMYLGVHTPLDVATSLGIAAFLVFAFHFVFRTEASTDKYMPYVTVGAVVLSVAFILYVFLVPDSGFSASADMNNLLSARDNAATLAGCLFGLALVYPLDRYFIRFDTKGRWYSQIVKFVIGIAVVLAIKILLKDPLNDLFGIYVGRAVRYFLIVAFAGAAWPLTFKFFERLKIDSLDRFSDFVASKFGKTAQTEE